MKSQWLQFVDLFAEKNKHLSRKEVLQQAKAPYQELKKQFEQQSGGGQPNCPRCGSNSDGCGQEVGKSKYCICVRGHKYYICPTCGGSEVSRSQLQGRPLKCFCKKDHIWEVKQ
jgi:hypothetical protein